MESLFKGLFDTDLTVVIGVVDFLLCMGVSLAIGLAMALAYMYRTRYTKSFVITLALLPTVVCVVIMMVNGNVGTGVAVAGAFSLVRFRSAPGTAQEICVIFVAMAAGLAFGMGYLAYGAIFLLICGAFLLLAEIFKFWEKKPVLREKHVRITIPESLDYTNVFDDIFEKYTEKYDLVKVKTTNMGSMFRVEYDIVMKDVAQEKEMVDEIRIRNGNLEVAVQRSDYTASEL